MNQNDFDVIKLAFVTWSKNALEELDEAKKYADEKLGLYCLEAKARALTKLEYVQMSLEKQVDPNRSEYRVIELAVVVWSGYSQEDLADARKWVYSDIGIYVLNSGVLPITGEEFRAFQACAPEYFSENAA